MDVIYKAFANKKIMSELEKIDDIIITSVSLTEDSNSIKLFEYLWQIKGVTGKSAVIKWDIEKKSPSSYMR